LVERYREAAAVVDEGLSRLRKAVADGLVTNLFEVVQLQTRLLATKRSYLRARLGCKLHRIELGRLTSSVFEQQECRPRFPLASTRVVGTSLARVESRVVALQPELPGVAPVRAEGEEQTAERFVATQGFGDARVLAGRADLVGCTNPCRCCRCSRGRWAASRWSPIGA
jgi:hypothetical protein